MTLRKTVILFTKSHLHFTKYDFFYFKIANGEFHNFQRSFHFLMNQSHNRFYFIQKFNSFSTFHPFKKSHTTKSGSRTISPLFHFVFFIIFEGFLFMDTIMWINYFRRPNWPRAMAIKWYASISRYMW